MAEECFACEKPLTNKWQFGNGLEFFCSKCAATIDIFTYTKEKDNDRTETYTHTKTQIS